MCSSGLQASRESLRLLAGVARQAAKGDTATALEVIGRFLAQPGRDEAKPAALYLKGVLEAARGREDTAEAVLRSLLVEYPRSDRSGMALTQLGLLLNRQARDTAAVEVLEPVEAAFPDSVFSSAALITLARSAERAGLNEKALTAYLRYLAKPLEPSSLNEARQRCATLLYNAGRVEEAYTLIGRVCAESNKDLRQLDLNFQMLAIGCLTGLGKADSSLRLAEELRRTSGGQLLDSPKMLFLLGHAHLALGHLGSADSAFRSLTALKGTPALGFTPDSVFHLLLVINLRQGRYDDYFRCAEENINALSDPDKALGVVLQAAAIGRETSRSAQVAGVLNVFKARFAERAQDGVIRLIEAGLARLDGETRKARQILLELVATTPDSILRAGALLETADLYLQSGDTLRCEAELRDYLHQPGDPLNNKDSLLWVNAGIERVTDNMGREAVLLESLVRDYPASRFWEAANERLEEVRMFDSPDPARAAGELLDLITQQGSQVPALRLAEIAAGQLQDYDRALDILQHAAGQSPEDRLQVIRYRFLSGLKLKRKGSVEATERIAQAWREIRYLLAQEKSFNGRDAAVSLFLRIYRSIYSSLNVSQVQESDSDLKRELAGLGLGSTRAEVLNWLGERFRRLAEADSGLAGSVLADSARARWNLAISARGDLDQTGQALLNLASSLEEASFAGARDSAAGLYGTLLDRYSGSRWASRAGLRLGIIHLEQDRYSLAYRMINDWIAKNRYAAGSPEVLDVLAEASFMTGRYARAAAILANNAASNRDNQTRRRLAACLVRALVELGNYSQAAEYLLRFRGNYRDEDSRLAAAALAVELYWAAESSELADKYLAWIGENSEYFAPAKIFSLRGQLTRGEDPERLRKEFERLKKSPWNRLFRIDPVFEAYRGMLACYAAEGKADKVAETRNDFRKNYPDQRASLAELMLDEIEFLIASGAAAPAAALYDDLNLLFRDVFPEDRTLWVGYSLARARADLAGADKQLESLAGRFPWSRYGVLARISLARLNLSVGRIDEAQALLAGLSGDIVRPYVREGLRAEISAAWGKWDQALAQRCRQWSLAPAREASGEILLGWAAAAVRAGKPAVAVQLLTSQWSADPNLAGQARYALALQYQAGGDYPRALAALEAVSDLFGANAETVLQALYRKGQILEEMGNKAQAIETYRELEQRAAESSDWLRSARARLKALGDSGAESAPGKGK